MAGAQEPDTTKAGEQFSFAQILSPIPCRAFGCMLDVLSLMPDDLAAPVLAVALRHECGLDVTGQILTNVIWKVKKYLPNCFSRRHLVGELPASLKRIQRIAPEHALVDIPVEHEHCCACGGDLVVSDAFDRHHINQPFGGSGGPATVEHRCKVYSLAAGVQYARMTETKCTQCHVRYLGGWQYVKGQKCWGHATGHKYVGGSMQDQYFVIPKYRSHYAVEVALLRKITADLVDSAGSFASAVVSWSKLHMEAEQQAAILGVDLTGGRHMREHLQMAWYAWQCIRRCGAGGAHIVWEFTDDGFERTLGAMAPCLRSAHLQSIAVHARECPQCSDCMLVLADGKHGARRFICAGLEGSVGYPDFGVELTTGCVERAPPGAFFCARCQPSKMKQSALIPQDKVVGAELVDAPDGATKEIRYVVACKDPDTEDVFEALLPRGEVQAELLARYEVETLPVRGAPSTAAASVPWKGALQKRRWMARWGPNQRECSRSAPSRPDPTAKRGGGAPAAGGRAKSRRSAATVACSRESKSAGKEQSRRKVLKRPAANAQAVFAKPRAAQATGWLAPDARGVGGEVSQCGVDKDVERARRRRSTGGIVTATLPCGVPADWTEIWRGESVELVYLFLMQFYKDLDDLGVRLHAVGYDNACKLLALAREKRRACLPSTEEFVSRVSFMLDRFHRQNHTWCLSHMPEVDPHNPANERFVRNRNTEACEQLNLWIAGRTRVALELTRGRFVVYWWVLFGEHKEWLEREAVALRRRCSRGGLARNPDMPKPHVAPKAELAR